MREAEGGSAQPSPPMEEREKNTSVHGDSAGSSNVEAFHEPSNEHAAPTELKEGPRGLSAIDMALLRSFSNRFKVPVHARSRRRLCLNRVARIKQRPPFHEPSNEHAAPTELKEGPRGLSAIDMALLRSFSNRFKVPVHARSRRRLCPTL